MNAKKTLFAVLLIAALFLQGSGAGLGLVRGGPSALPAVAGERALALVPPPETQRLAAQHLENMRGSELAPGWENAVLSLEPTPLYRPDLKEIAYWEFEVWANQKPAGFIIVSTGPHDFPIPHWDFSGLSPTQQLRSLAAQQQNTAVKFYKLDSLSYAAENDKGERSATIGDEIQEVSGLDMALLDQEILSEKSWTPAAGSDDSQPPTTGTLTETGPMTSTIQLTPWPSWQALKDGYAASYAVFLEDLRREAAREWAIENFAILFGTVLKAGDVYNLAMLCASPTVTPSGEGAAYVTAELVQRPGLLPVYTITVNKSDPPRELPLDVQVTCPGINETVKFIIAEPPRLLFLPLISRQQAGSSLAAGQSPALAAGTAPALAAPAGQSVGGVLLQPAAGLASQGDWGPWTFFWARNGTSLAFPYSQMGAGSLPNTSGCYSGCGATAWAMLFGWADYQAETNVSWTYWSPRKGIYRLNGGTGTNAIAPTFQDAGIRSITWEIRNYIGTFCVGSSGPTFPWRMGDAWRYMVNRSGTAVVTDFSSVGIRWDSLKVRARNSIVYRQTPAVIGTGWLSHYPLAMGYAWRSRTVRACAICWWDTTEYSEWFWVNQGWGGSDNGWVSASTWFAGEVYP